MKSKKFKIVTFILGIVFLISASVLIIFNAQNFVSASAIVSFASLCCRMAVVASSFIFLSLKAKVSKCSALLPILPRCNPHFLPTFSWKTV